MITLQADSFISTRYQSNDDYAKFTITPVSGSESTGGGGSHPTIQTTDVTLLDTTNLVRIKVKADGKMLHANDLGGGTKAWPSDVVSTLSQSDDDYNHFILGAKAADGSFTIQTKASQRYWAVNNADEGIVFTVANEQDASRFTLTPASGGGGGGAADQCFSVTSPGFNPSYVRATTQ